MVVLGNVYSDLEDYPKGADLVEKGCKILKLKQKESDYKKYYTPELIKLVEQKHAQDLLHFGYNFDGPVDESIFIDPKSFSFSHRKPGVVPST